MRSNIFVKANLLFLSLYLIIASAAIYGFFRTRHGSPTNMLLISSPAILVLILMILLMRSSSENHERITHLGRSLGLILDTKDPYGKPRVSGRYKGIDVSIEEDVTRSFTMRDSYGLGFSSLMITASTGCRQQLCMFYDGIKLVVKEDFASMKQHDDKDEILRKIDADKEFLMRKTGWVMVFDRGFCRLMINHKDPKDIIKYIDTMLGICRKIQ